MKNKITMLSIASFVVGVIIVAIGILNGGSTALRISEKGISFESKNANAEIVTQKISNAVESVKIDLDYTECYVSSGDEFSITFDKSRFTAVEENGVLKIEKIEQENSEIQIFNFDLGIAIDGSSKEIHLKVPKDFTIENFEFNGVSGDIEIKNQTFGTLILNSSYQKISLENALAEKIVIDQKSGDVEIDDTKTNILEISSAYSEIDIENLVANTVLSESKSGDISLENSEIGNVDISNSYGDVDLSLIGSKADYSINTVLSYGNLELNGEKQSETMSIVGKDNTKSISISLKSGDAEIDFIK